jgi:hypothetical protein
MRQLAHQIRREPWLKVYEEVRKVIPSISMFIKMDNLARTTEIERIALLIQGQGRER